jgi:hypothetical protein
MLEATPAVLVSPDPTGPRSWSVPGKRKRPHNGDRDPHRRLVSAWALQPPMWLFLFSQPSGSQSLGALSLLVKGRDESHLSRELSSR